ncbi:MAG: glycosyltransferase family 2 protein [Candidatus Omnitrophota bacterium]|nr:MAG: glycosyltransferase family 2 protein [Candidatus Omnitrophota bacterium]
MKEHKYNISIVMPAFNEAQNIEETVRSCFSTLATLGIEGEVVVTDDGSVDDTLKILNSLAAEFPRLKVVNHEKNEGYGAALKDAVSSASGRYIVSIDSDGQFDIGEIPLLIEQKDRGFDIVSGYRKKKKDSLFKIIADRGLNIIVRIMFGVNYRDTNCAFKIYSPGVLDRIKIEARGYQAPTEILMKLHTLGYSIGQVGISHYAREKGKSALSPLVTIYKMFTFLLYLRLKIHLYRRKIIAAL